MVLRRGLMINLGGDDRGEKEVQDSSCRGKTGGVPRTLNFPHDWGI